LIDWFRRRLGRDRYDGLPGIDAETFVYIMIPESIGPMNRGEKYEGPLTAALEREQAAEITGGGSQLGDERPDGTRPIESCGIDINVTDAWTRESTLTLLRSELVGLGVPIGTELHYTIDGSRLKDQLVHGGWVQRQPRTFLHPGFGC
jgi:hypothetical protein